MWLPRLAWATLVVAFLASALPWSRPHRPRIPWLASTYGGGDKSGGLDDSQLAAVLGNLTRLDERVARIDRNLAFLAKDKAREAAARVVGRKHATPFVVATMKDLLELASGRDAEFHNPLRRETYSIAHAALRRLLEEDVPGELLSCIAAKLELREQEAGRPALRLLTEEGRVDAEGMQRYLEQEHAEPSVARALVRLDEVLVSLRAGNTLNLLENWESDGTGFMCLLAAALPGLYLDPAAGDSSLIPPRELHIDLSSPLDLKTGVLELGIVGSFEDALSGVVHMGHCFRSLQWLVQANLGLSHHLRERKATPRLFARCFVVGGVRPKEEGVLPWLAQAFGYRLDVQHLGGKDAGQQD